MLDAPEDVKLLWVTERFRQFCALVSLANIFRKLIFNANGQASPTNLDRETVNAENTKSIGKDFPHKKEEMTKVIITMKLKAIRSKFRTAVDSGRTWQGSSPLP